MFSSLFDIVCHAIGATIALLIISLVGAIFTRTVNQRSLLLLCLTTLFLNIVISVFFTVTVHVAVPALKAFSLSHTVQASGFRMDEQEPTEIRI